MPLWWPQVRRGSTAAGRRSTDDSLWCSAGSGSTHAARLCCGVPRGVGGSAGRSGREAMKPQGNRSQAEGLSKRFLGYPERSCVYHYDSMPRGLPPVHFLKANGICTPPDIRGVALPPTVSEEPGNEEPKLPGLCVSERSIDGQREWRAVVVGRANVHGCVEQPPLQMTGSACEDQARRGAIDEEMDGQHSYPHIHNKGLFPVGSMPDRSAASNIIPCS